MEFPDFVPKEVREFYLDEWANPPTDATPQQMRTFDAAKQLVTADKMEGIYNTLSKQHPFDTDWKGLFDAMVWPAAHSNERKRQARDKGNEHKALVRKAELLVDDLVKVLEKMDNISTHHSQYTKSSDTLNSLARIIRHSAEDSRSPLVRERFLDTRRKAMLDKLEITDVMICPDVVDIVGSIGYGLYEISHKYAVDDPNDNDSYMPQAYTRQKATWQDNLRLFIEEMIQFNRYGENAQHRPWSICLRQTDYLTWALVTNTDPHACVRRESVRDVINERLNQGGKDIGEFFLKS